MLLYLKQSNLLFSFISNAQFISNSIHTNILHLVSKYVFVTLVDQLRRKVGVRSYSSLCYTCRGFFALAKKNRLTLKKHSILLDITERVPQ